MNILLLDYAYEPLRFISVEKSLKHICKQKVDVLANWNESIGLANTQMKYPATIRLKQYTYVPVFKLRFSKYAVLKRDSFVCQYCGANNCAVTIDHVVPKSKGGPNDWLNCVAACVACNKRKGDKSLGESGMKLLNQPYHPINTNETFFEYIAQPVKHKDWQKWIRPIT